MANNRREKTLSKDSTNIQGAYMKTNKAFEAIVTWADGVQDLQRECNICGTVTCIKPTHSERYIVKSDTLAAKWDIDNPVI